MKKSILGLFLLFAGFGASFVAHAADEVVLVAQGQGAIERAQAQAQGAENAQEPDAQEEQSCPICMQPFTEEQPAVKTNCGHDFHGQCLIGFYVTKRNEGNRELGLKCAVCRNENDRIIRRICASVDPALPLARSELLERLRRFERSAFEWIAAGVSMAPGFFIGQLNGLISHTVLDRMIRSRRAMDIALDVWVICSSAICVNMYLNYFYNYINDQLWRGRHVHNAGWTMIAGCCAGYLFGRASNVKRSVLLATLLRRGLSRRIINYVIEGDKCIGDIIVALAGGRLAGFIGARVPFERHIAAFIARMAIAFDGQH